MIKPCLTLLIIFITISINTRSQDSIYIAVWNFENLFDTIDDLGKEDEAFTPGGIKSWTPERFDEKLKNLAKVIKYMNDFNGPDILGIVELEHKYLADSLSGKYFFDRNYKTISYESPDIRGIQNALIYDADIFELVESGFITVEFFSDYKTRDILYVRLKWQNQFLDLFVNHWPSRRGGVERSEPRRINAAATLKEFIENELAPDKRNSHIIMMGDFNDEPDNISLNEILGAKNSETLPPDFSDDEYDLYNLSFSLFEEGFGTHLYENDYNFLDHIIIGENLLDHKTGEYIIDSFEIINPDFIEMRVKNNKIITPTFDGEKYLGGFSDHYPVGAKFYITN